MDRNLSMLFLLNMAVSFSSQLIQPLFPLYLKGLGASEVEIGLAVAIGSISATALMLPSGILADRVGRKRLLLIGVALSSLSPFLMTAVSDWRLTVPPYMMFSSSFSFFVTTRMALVAESAKVENRARLFGLMNLAWPIGGITAPYVSGLMIESFGWKTTLILSGGIGIASLIPTLLIREKRLKTSEEKVKSSKLPFIRDHVGLLILFFSFHLFETTGLGMVDLVLPLMMEDRFHLSYHLIGLFFTGANLVTLITQIPSGYLADRYGRKKIIIACVSGIPVALGFWLFMDNWISMLILYVTAQGLWSMTWPATLALLTDSVKPEVIGTAFGIRMTGVRLGFTVGPAVSGVMYSVLGYPVIFITAALLYVASIPLATRFKEARVKIIEEP
ncbi:MFS transporter [Candidatus Bathyarchaeota archaeon]|nr:MFS transporter [Candidatus Bathyarchaeota archaeon]